MEKMKFLLKACLPIFALVGVLLLCVNIYGEFQSLTPNGVLAVDLRFPQDKTLTFEESLDAIVRENGESEEAYVRRLNGVVAKSLAHIHWNEYEDIDTYYQRVPVWENFILYFMSIVTDMPEYKKYHFGNYKRSLERGIGICGDASMVMNQILEKEGIESQIVSFPGHVILEARLSNGDKILSDADFGVIMPFSVEELNKAPNLAMDYYKSVGFSDREIGGLVRSYALDSEKWNGVKHFITKKYYFEYLAYFLKWALPVALLFFAWMIYRSEWYEVKQD
tara:strand:+ start:1209 stop:2045 length:837 start_codon:yes stop_codon:yes gene_type:complete